MGSTTSSKALRLEISTTISLGPFITDFACLEKKLVLEIDGGYHDVIYNKDIIRQELISDEGWEVLRFTNEDVIEDVEAVVIAIVKQLGMIEIYLQENADKSETRKSPLPRGEG